MTRKILLQLSPRSASDSVLIKDALHQELGTDPDKPLYFKVIKRSIDARGKSIRINLSVLVSETNSPEEPRFEPAYQNVSESKSLCHIIGAGPAGLFAALRCLERGIRPIVFERGKDVQARRRDLAAINRLQEVNPESNYCFGEGGAGTYSDGKLYTRSTKRGDVEKILRTLVYHGASSEILVDAHPHIGTNKLPQLIQNIRQTILKHGGLIQFNSKLLDFTQQDGKIVSVSVSTSGVQNDIPVQHLILATGHSARDIYELLHNKNILLEAKPFAMGVRAEHPQELIDSIQYHCQDKASLIELRHYLPAASYSLVSQVENRGVYSFCMCPGGIIAPCATKQDEVVTNGWSPSKRNNPFANSGIVVGLGLHDFTRYQHMGPLAGLELQKELEHRAWQLGGYKQSAPAQRLTDFVQGKNSSSLPDCSYQPGIVSANLLDVLGSKIGTVLKHGFKTFGQKMRGYLSSEAVIVGVESRTSTPVRIPRDKDRLHHPQLHNLFPCGEGAGYAGGIMSAAMDGERCANAIGFI
ncbi:MAG TPA: FAD-binding protein [Bacteroidia bacterium]|nr:FAD-binding protein [Bacteroidia bacterium]